jgi:hypothetical protein
VGSLTSHNPIGLHGLLQGIALLFFLTRKELQTSSVLRVDNESRCNFGQWLLWAGDMKGKVQGLIVAGGCVPTACPAAGRERERESTDCSADRTGCRSPEGSNRFYPEDGGSRYLQKPDIP